MSRNYTASVKVMRSHDYCHFEICLGADGITTMQEVDELRKQAARLADKAVAQYQIAKRAAQRKSDGIGHIRYYKEEAEEIRALAPTDRTSEQQAALKAHDDAVFHASREYDYQDVWEEDEKY